MRILFISLGCDKNLVDSEHMLGALTEKGWTMTDSPEDAEVIIINTCCFIHDAREESHRQHSGNGGVPQKRKLPCSDRDGMSGGAVPPGDPGGDPGGGRCPRDQQYRRGDRSGGTGSAGRTPGDHEAPGRDFQTGGKKTADHGNKQRVPEDRRGLRQTLYILYHPQAEGRVPQRPHGGTAGGGLRNGGAGSTGTDPGGPRRRRFTERICTGKNPCTGSCGNSAGSGACGGSASFTVIRRKSIRN